jgi:pimeloyl-ACP methyl ester carboxylesterase
LISTFKSVYTGANGRPSPFDLSLSNKPIQKPLVVFAHGYKGYKDWGAWHLVAKKFAGSGFDFLKFNFSHNGGTVEQPIDFPDLKAFSENTYSKELLDLANITDLVCEKGIHVDGVNHSWDQIYLIGHSRGGGMAVLHAARDPRVAKLSTWSAVADFGERFKFDMEAWKRDGLTYVLNGRTKQKMPHKYSYFQDFEQHKDELSIEKAARKLEIPWLIAHGTADEAVSFDNAERLHVWGKGSSLFPASGIGHTFGAIHPWPRKELPKALEKVVDRTIAFFRKKLS